MKARSLVAARLTVLLVALVGLPLVGLAGDYPGQGAMKKEGLDELADSNLNKYVGRFQPAVSDPAGDWEKHTFDTDGGDGPTCIDGTPFTVFTRERDPENLVIFLNGGGGCWQDFYFCTTQAAQTPPFPAGVFADSFDAGGEIVHNPFADWSMMWVSQCDGSVYTGDNEVEDLNPTWAAIAGSTTRSHRGLRNLTAAMDLANDIWANPKKVFFTGSSAGGAAVALNGSMLYRFIYPTESKLYALDDGGAPVGNPDQPGAEIRAADWDLAKFYPASCVDCDPAGQGGGPILSWRHENDNGIREALYTTDGDFAIRFFIGVFDHLQFRNMLLDVTDPINEAHPNRYKRFIPHGTSHTLLRGDLYYTQSANGVRFVDWVEDFVNHAPGWVDIVEDFVPAP